MKSFAPAESLYDWCIFLILVFGPVEGEEHQNDRNQHHIGIENENIVSVESAGHQETKFKKS